MVEFAFIDHPINDHLLIFKKFNVDVIGSSHRTVNWN